MGIYRRKKTHKGIRDVKRACRTRARGRDLDQIAEDVLRHKRGLPLKDYKNLENEDLPGLGKFKCIECDRHFIHQEALQTHQKTRAHKRRLKLLYEPMYTQNEAELAVGLKTSNLTFSM